MKVKVAVVQDSPIVFNLNKTLDKVEDITTKAAKKGAKLLLFPEAFVSSYPKGLDFGARIGSRSSKGRDDFYRYYNSAISLEGSEYLRLLNIAKSNKVFLVIGIIEKTKGTLYCTILHISDEGLLLGKRRKVMPTALERIVWGFGDGSTLKAFDTKIGKIGSVICWENYMPLLRMSMYNQDVQIYCAPTADDRNTWLPTIQHIAMEGRCFVLSACQFLQLKDCPKDYNIKEKDPNFVIMKGGSCIISPLGKVIQKPVWNKRLVLYQDLDFKEIIKGKYDFDVTGHYSRPDIFELNINTKKNKIVNNK
tara:strand:- start:190 stop:1110 length:921 start_codon:yes stop_codon:yes gene_type:complete